MDRVRAGLRIPNGLNTDLIEEANRQGISKNALILQILWDWTKSKTAEATKTAQLPPAPEDSPELD